MRRKFDDKTDPRLTLGYGSAWHILRLLGFHRDRFSAQVAREIGADAVDWLDFVPSRTGKNYPSGVPIRERELVRLEFLENDTEIQSRYDDFWPPTKDVTKQQNWDAIGRIHVRGETEWLLVEAKAHLEEITRKGSGARGTSREKIQEALDETKAILGVDGSRPWIDGYYQYANRLATLHFLNKHKRNTRLLFLYFCGDQNPKSTCPRSEAEWVEKVKEVERDLGMDVMTGELVKRVNKMFLHVEPDQWAAKADDV